jgi:general stress protein CsbA
MVQKKHIVAKDVVGLLLGEIVITKKTHIVAKDVVGLLLGEIVKYKKNTHRHEGCGWLTSRR